MKLYDTLPVDMTYQDFGSTWAIYLIGEESNIELGSNALYNFGAVNFRNDWNNFSGGKVSLSFIDHLNTIAVLWSNSAKMFKFFRAQAFHYHLNPIRYVKVTLPNKLRKLYGLNMSKAFDEIARLKVLELKQNKSNYLNYSDTRYSEEKMALAS